MSSLWGMYMMGSFVSMVSIATAPRTPPTIPEGHTTLETSHRFLQPLKTTVDITLYPSVPSSDGWGTCSLGCDPGVRDAI